MNPEWTTLYKDRVISAQWIGWIDPCRRKGCLIRQIGIRGNMAWIGLELTDHSRADPRGIVSTNTEIKYKFQLIIFPIKPTNDARRDTHHKCLKIEL